jgi:hypothetical protein
MRDEGLKYEGWLILALTFEFGIWNLEFDTTTPTQTPLRLPRHHYGHNKNSKLETFTARQLVRP